MSLSATVMPVAVSGWEQPPESPTSATPGAAQRRVLMAWLAQISGGAEPSVRSIADRSGSGTLGAHSSRRKARAASAPLPMSTGRSTHMRTRPPPIAYARIGPHVPRKTWPNPARGSSAPWTRSAAVNESSRVSSANPSARRSLECRPSATTVTSARISPPPAVRTPTTRSPSRTSSTTRAPVRTSTSPSRATSRRRQSTMSGCEMASPRGAPPWTSA